jgi:hypothetical protein
MVMTIAPAIHYQENMLYFCIRASIKIKICPIVTEIKKISMGSN